MSEKEKSFAYKLFETIFKNSILEDELFEKINYILDCDVNKCLDPNFIFKCSDIGHDYYDGSIEIILDASSERMTDEQCHSVFNLGFGIIYESKEDECFYISRNKDNKIFRSKVNSVAHGDTKNQWKRKGIALTTSIEKYMEIVNDASYSQDGLDKAEKDIKQYLFNFKQFEAPDRDIE